MSAKQFHEFARECMRWAEEATSEEDRRHFIEMAKAWVQAASELRELSHHPEPPSPHGPHAEKPTVNGKQRPAGRTAGNSTARRHHSLVRWVR
jgi:hypothetical protein